MFKWRSLKGGRVIRIGGILSDEGCQLIRNISFSLTKKLSVTGLECRLQGPPTDRGTTWLGRTRRAAGWAFVRSTEGPSQSWCCWTESASLSWQTPQPMRESCSWPTVMMMSRCHQTGSLPLHEQTVATYDQLYRKKLHTVYPMLYKPTHKNGKNYNVINYKHEYMR